MSGFGDIDLEKLRMIVDNFVEIKSGNPEERINRIEARLDRESLDEEARQATARAIENRLLRMEWTVAGHAEQIEKLQDTTDEISSELKQISDILIHIKWSAIGAAATYLAHTFGVADLLKALL